jgi:predicted transcriptional regulator
VNPDHLEPVIFAVNVARGASCTISNDMIERTKSLLSNGMRQVDIAELVGISQPAVSDIKRGKKDWRLNARI